MDTGFSFLFKRYVIFWSLLRFKAKLSGKKAKNPSHTHLQHLLLLLHGGTFESSQETSFHLSWSMVYSPEDSRAMSPVSDLFWGRWHCDNIKRMQVAVRGTIMWWDRKPEWRGSFKRAHFLCVYYAIGTHIGVCTCSMHWVRMYPRLHSWRV